MPALAPVTSSVTLEGLPDWIRGDGATSLRTCGAGCLDPRPDVVLPVYEQALDDASAILVMPIHPVYAIRAEIDSVAATPRPRICLRRRVVATSWVADRPTETSRGDAAGANMPTETSREDGMAAMRIFRDDE